MTLLWSIRNNHIVLNCRCGHVGIIALQELIDVLGEDVELDVVERSARCNSCGFKRISSVHGAEICGGSSKKISGACLRSLRYWSG